MRNALKISLLAALAVSFAAAARAQVRDARVISARAGAVNFVSGRVEFNREGEGAWQALTGAAELDSGDAVRAGAGGRVEVLLNPGSYLRAGDGAQFELSDASLEDLRLKLTRGSAVVEATGYGETDLSILVETPQTRVRIVRSGIYRFNVLPSGVTEVGVLKGRALVGADEMLVKGGRLVRAGEGAPPEVAKAKFRKEDRDALDLWSRERGKELAKLNEKVSARHVATVFGATSFGNNLFGNPFAPRLNGVWYFHPHRGFYTFLPFHSYWRSPYGHGYHNQLWVSPGYAGRGYRGGSRGHVGGVGGNNSGSPHAGNSGGGRGGHSAP
ncbi:MAG TPA: FecR domain-containing protein, partial [Pyrinomonadaceae bacterium]|nr:FecR domain-containing protein [Pyrinomonadaceae bacterium]